MKVAISSESSCDLPQELIDRYNVKIIPYHIQVGDMVFEDGAISTAELFERADALNTLPKTSAINEVEFEEHFSKLKEEYDSVVHISLSSEITSATKNAESVAKRLGDVYVVDSRTLSSGIGLLVIYACQLAEKGLDAKDIAEKVRARTPYVQCSSVIERLDYLYKGGRCNSLQLLGANLLKLRPRIVIRDGVIGNDKKYRGNIVRVQEKYCKEILEDFPNPDLSCVIIVYTTATPEMIAASRKACVEAGFKNIYEAVAGGTVASHCGAHTLGIMYLNDGNIIRD
ncbi:MAG: DegV family protein [Clostridiales bacterium]|nr:DegV family protein [Clostridiales bacterium]